jgi:DNA processing protein
MQPLTVWLQGLLLAPSQLHLFVNTLLREGALSSKLARRLHERAGGRDRTAWAEQIVERTEKLGGRILIPPDPDYPEFLLHLHQPPCALFARGNPACLSTGNAVAVVGSRRAGPSARMAARGLGLALARSSVSVISGLARGVDSSAHEGCLAGKGKPVAVLGTGLDEAYPPANVELQEEVARRGCVLSEYPPGQGARQWHFIARNRIIAALASVVVVIEAGEKSGALITAEFASELGREVMAYPGGADDPAYAGSLRLLKEGAGLARGPADILHELCLEEKSGSQEAPLGLQRPSSPAQIARDQGMELSQVLAQLAQLELEGRVRRVEGGRYVATPCGE